MAGTKTTTQAGAERGGEAEGLASRWSRLKQEARDAVPAEPQSEAQPDAAAEAEAVAAEPVAPEDLPDVETLTYESDFTAFLREGVPEELQRLALRKLWRSDPVLANVDGLNDYDLDYRVLGIDTRVTEALLAQREVKEQLLRGAEDIHQRPSAVQAARPPAAEIDAAAREPVPPEADETAAAAPAEAGEVAEPEAETSGEKA